MFRKARYCPIFVALFLFFPGLSSAQDAAFSQFYANPMYLNPAMAGTNRCPRFALNYRNQWPALPSSFVTYSASYDKHAPLLNGGVGLQVMNDREGEGTINTNTISGMYSYKMDPNRFLSVRFGFQATYFQKALDWSRLQFSDQIDSRYGYIYASQEIPGQNSRSGVDFSTGFFAYTDKFYFGSALHHLTRPDARSHSHLPRPR